MYQKHIMHHQLQQTKKKHRTPVTSYTVCLHPVCSLPLSHVVSGIPQTLTHVQFVLISLLEDVVPKFRPLSSHITSSLLQLFQIHPVRSLPSLSSPSSHVLSFFFLNKQSSLINLVVARDCALSSSLPSYVSTLFSPLMPVFHLFISLCVMVCCIHPLCLGIFTGALCLHCSSCLLLLFCVVWPIYGCQSYENMRNGMCCSISIGLTVHLLSLPSLRCCHLSISYILS